MSGPESLQARLSRGFDPAELRRIKRLWVRHSIAEDRRDIDGLVATLSPSCTYEIVVMVPDIASVMVRGGAFFADFTPARVAGSSLGGGFLKLHGVYAGFQMELVTDDLPIITTRVRTVSVLPTRDVAVM